MMKNPFPDLKNSKIKYLAAILIVGILLMVTADFKFSDDKREANKSKSSEKDNLKMQNDEKRLEETINKIKGVSNASVFITYENNGVHKISENIKETTKISGENTEISTEKNNVSTKRSTSEEPFVNEEKLPQVRGVFIVAKGVDNPKINAEITEAVSAVLGVAVHKVKILPSD